MGHIFSIQAIFCTRVPDFQTLLNNNIFGSCCPLLPQCVLWQNLLGGAAGQDISLRWHLQGFQFSQSWGSCNQIPMPASSAGCLQCLWMCESLPRSSCALYCIPSSLLFRKGWRKEMITVFLTRIKWKTPQQLLLKLGSFWKGAWKIEFGSASLCWVQSTSGICKREM